MVYAVNIGDELSGLLDNVANVALKVVIFLAIMALGWFVARWLRKWLTRVLQRVGLDRAVERGGLGRMLGSSSASYLAARLVVAGFLLFVLQLAFGIFGPNAVSDLIRSVVAWLPKLFVAIVLVVVAAAVAGWLKDLVTEALGGLSYGRTLGTVAQVFVLAFGIMAALNQLGVATAVTLPVLIAALATIGGVAIVGVGGGLIKPMQHRWERMLNRAETETTIAADKVRTHRAATQAGAGPATDRNANAPGGFGQPAYSGTGVSHEKAQPRPTSAQAPTAAQPTVPQPPAER